MCTPLYRLLAVLGSSARFVAGGLLSLALVSSSKATLVDLTSTIPSDQAVVFSDDFNDNSAGWTNIGTILGTATEAFIGTDPLSGGTESAWFPSDGSGASSSAIVSEITLSTPIDIVAVGSFDVYFRSRIEEDSISNRFGTRVIEKEVAGNFAALSILHQLGYRDIDGTQTLIALAGDQIDVDEYKNFRFSFTDVGQTGHPGFNGITLVGSVYNTGTTSWDQFVTSTLDYRYSTSGTDAGLFETFSINSRNPGANQRAVFDAFAITTPAPVVPVPEPGTLGLLALGGLLLLRRRRSRR